MNEKGPTLSLSKGFTLIEMMVVMSIIGILMALTLTGIGSSRKGARDARRKVDLETIRSGLEMYKSDCNFYPSTDEIMDGDYLNGDNCSTPNTNIYIQLIPKDPLDPARVYAYTRLTTSTYTLCATLEQSTTLWCVYNP